MLFFSGRRYKKRNKNSPYEQRRKEVRIAKLAEKGLTLEDVIAQHTGKYNFLQVLGMRLTYLSLQ